jgi:AMP-polyphosphate phosphotransferase
MFEASELGLTLDKEEYQAIVPDLRVDLLNAQFELKSADFPVFVVLSGDDRVATSELANLLHEWMDSRYIKTYAPGAETQEELEQPALWKYWRQLPRRGATGMYVSDWTAEAIWGRFNRDSKQRAFERALERLTHFESMLVDEGALVLKFWLHLSRSQHEKRCKKESSDGWQLTPEDREIAKHYPRWIAIAEDALRRTGTAAAPWHVIESADRRYRSVEVARRISEALAERLTKRVEPAATAPVMDAPSVTLADRTGNPRTVLDQLDLTRTLPDEEYDERLPELQQRLRELSMKTLKRGIATLVVLEGWDAAGKGGAIRRMTGGLDARYFRVFPIAAPSDEERSHHYLWRFWHRLPRPGHFAIFDRSWYGRVLVERVEKLATEQAWKRAYAEINEFEEQMVEHGSVLVKFWLHIDQEEQLRRFEARAQTKYKKYKLTPEDYRNRKNADEYERAVNDMVARTSTPSCPWILVSSQDKRWARVQVLENVVQALERRLERR